MISRQAESIQHGAVDSNLIALHGITAFLQDDFVECQCLCIHGDHRDHDIAAAADDFSEIFTEPDGLNVCVRLQSVGIFLGYLAEHDMAGGIVGVDAGKANRDGIVSHFRRKAASRSSFRLKISCPSMYTFPESGRSSPPSIPQSDYRRLTERITEL